MSLAAKLIGKYMYSTKHENSPYVKAYVDESNIFKWNFLLHGMRGRNDEFLHGEYIVQFDIPVNIPFKSAKASFLTPTGVFEVGVPVCVQLPPYFSFITQMHILISSLIAHEDSEIEKIRACAEDSQNFNAAFYPELVQKIKGWSGNFKS